MCLKELDLTIDSLFRLINWLRILFLQPLILIMLRFSIFSVHIDNAKDMVVPKIDTFNYLCLQFFDIGVLRLIRLNRQAFKQTTQRLEVIELGWSFTQNQCSISKLSHINPQDLQKCSPVLALPPNDQYGTS